MLVSAVMITGKNPARRKLAEVAIRCFLEQTHREKELVVVNDGGFSVGCQNPRVREIMIPFSPKVKLGDLRNIALEHARGELVIQWDDDDWHAPERMELQARAFVAESAVLLKQQIRYSFEQNSAFLHSYEPGIIGTILHQRNCKSRYPSFRRSEDVRFLASFSKRRVLDASPPLYIRFCHGSNTWDADFIMQDFAESIAKGRWELKLDERALLRHVLKNYYGVKI